MIEYEKLRVDIDHYLMELKHHKSLVCLAVDSIIVTRRNSQVDLYLRIIAGNRNHLVTTTQ